MHRPTPGRVNTGGGSIESTELKFYLQRLSHVYWIGGGSCAGKSTIARQIAEKYRLHLYATDDVMAEHSRRSNPKDAPLLHEFIAMDLDDRWVNRSPATMLQTFHWFCGEAFDKIVEDLLSIPNEERVIVEGFRILPHLVRPFLSASNHAVWLLPSPQFRTATMKRRGGCTSGFLAKTSNPERALQNLLKRDEMFTDRLRNEVESLALCAIEVDGAIDECDWAALVAKELGL